MNQFLSKYFLGDRIIWIVIFALFIISTLAIYSATGTLAYRYQGGNTTFYLFRHLQFVIIGIIIIIVFQRISYRTYAKIYKWLLGFSAALLLVTLLFGISRNSASRWLALPGLGMAFQPSDLAKFALIMFTSRVLAMNQDDEVGLKNAFKQITVVTFIICGLILPANFSTAFLLFATIFMLMFVGRVPMKNLLQLSGISVALMAVFILLAVTFASESRVETWKNRILSYTASDSGTSSENINNYQIDQAKIAIALGGITGQGPGNSVQRNFLPHPYSDFIYAIIVEEYGLIFGIGLILLYLYLLYRAGTIVRKSTRTFPAFLVIGLTLSIILQAFTNMAVAVQLIPVTGQPLPLVSMGGTSILFTSISLGIILSISTSEQEQLDASKEEEQELAQQAQQPEESKPENDIETTEIQPIIEV